MSHQFYDIHVDMDRQRLALLLIVIFLFAGLMTYFAVEAFMSGSEPTNFPNYKEYDKYKRDSSTLCDPCYDPNCKTKYPHSQSECNNPNHTVVPTGTPYLPRGGPLYSDAEASTSMASAPMSYSSLAEKALQPLASATPSVSQAAPSAELAAPAAITPNAAASLESAANTIKSILGTSEPNMKSSDAMPLKGTTQPTDPDTVTMSATDFYDYLRPQILKTVTDAMNKAPASSTSDVPALKANSLANPMPSALGDSKQGINSPGVRQGDDYSSCKPFNKDDYIRKDSIPCYACSL